MSQHRPSAVEAAELISSAPSLTDVSPQICLSMTRLIGALKDMPHEWVAQRQ